MVAIPFKGSESRTLALGTDLRSSRPSGRLPEPMFRCFLVAPRQRCLPICWALGLFACSASTTKLQYAQPATEAPQISSAAVTVPAARPSDTGLLSDNDRMRGILWRFRAASPVVARPVIAADGTTFVVTRENAVHSIGPDGAYRWSYTLDGPIAGVPAVDKFGNVYVPTRWHLISLVPAGTQRWLFRAPDRVRGGLAVHPRGSAHFIGGDHQLWTVSTRAGVLWRAAFRAKPTTDPVVLQDGRVAVGLEDGAVALVRGTYQREYVELSGAVRQLVRQGSTLYAVTEQGLTAVSGEGSRRWRVNNVVAVAANADSVVAVSRDSRLLRFDLRGEPVGSAEPLPAELSAPLAITPAGTVLLPGQDGALWYRRPGEAWQSVSIGSASLWQPVVTANRLVVASGDGNVAALQLDGDV